MTDRYFPFPDFDPKWNFKEAHQHISGDLGRRCPFMRWEHWRQLHEDVKEYYESGHKFALIEALEICARYDLPMPEWVAQDFCVAIFKWEFLESKTLDEAFGVSRPKGFRYDSARRNIDLRLSVSIEVLEAQKRGVAIDQQLFDDIAQKLGTSGGTASRVYYSKKNELNRLIGKKLINKP